MRQFALIGNPNSGKTTLFNALTGSTAHVGNWPGVTVDKKDGIYKKLDELISIVDLPGIYSLSPYTPEEIISRNFILDEKPDCIINIVDATNLERNLYLTTQLLELDVPIVIALNMMDAVTKSGDKINLKELEKKMNVPVVEISALKNQGIKELMEIANEISKSPRKGQTVLRKSALYHLVDDVNVVLKRKNIENPLFHAVKLIEFDELEVKNHQDVLETINEFKKSFNDKIFDNDFEALIANERYVYITNNFSSILIKKDKEIKLTSSDKIDRVLTHKIWGIPVFLVILFLVFHMTFSTNFLFLGRLLPDGFLSLQGTTFEGIFGDGSIYSPGVILTNLLELFLDTISNLIRNWLSNTPSWISAFIVDGVLAGLFAVLGFLPQILLLFLFFSILEDSGYMARVAFILDRILRKFGLSGRAFMPMIMGFGCSVPAMINTRTLSDNNERTATIRIIPFFSCGAKLPILTAIAGGLVQFFNVGNADIITYSMYLIGMITAIVTIILMRNTTMRGKISPFIMELPNYHMPRFSNLMLHLWDKLKHFIQKAFTIILVSTIAIWFLSSFSWKFEFLLEDATMLFNSDPIKYASLEGVTGLVNFRMNESIIASVGKLIQPLFTPLGFGSQLTKVGWVFAVATLTGLIAKENVISTLGVLTACIAGTYIASEDGVLEVVTMIQATGITKAALISFMVFNLTTIPCFATVATAKAELPKGKFITTLIFWLITSFIVSSMIYVIGSWWWTSFIFLVVIITIIVSISFYNKARDNKQLIGE
ncbi:MAG: ferrous iron transport protein B [Erysipelotrichales bacterium]|nr:ferrous iron transport protein B [Erysipelotrichales bacterium]